MKNWIAKLLVSYKFRMQAAETDLEAQEIDRQVAELEAMKEPNAKEVEELERKVKITHGEELKEATQSLAQAKGAQAGIPKAIDNFRKSAASKRARARDMRHRATIIFKR